jgi:hypothetical protein
MTNTAGTEPSAMWSMEIVWIDEPVLVAYADRCAARPAFQRAYALEESG